MRLSLLVTFLITVSAVVGVLLVKFDQIFLNDKLNWGEAQSRAQLSAIVHSMEVEVSSISETLDLAMIPLANLRRDYSANAPYGRFHMIAKLKNPQGLEWAIDDRFFREGTPTKSWAQNYTVLALRMLRESDVKAGHSAIISLLDPNRKTFFLIVTKSKSNNQWYGALTGPEMFQQFVDQQKGQLSTLFIVNLQGQALAHTIPEYVGGILSEDPIVANIMKGEITQGSGKFQDLRGEEVLGFFEQVGETNAFVVVTTSIEKLIGDRKNLKIQIILLGFGLMLIGTALLLFVSQPEKQMAKIPLAPAAPTPMPVAPPAPTHPSAPSNALTKDVKNPMSAILGNVQIIKAKTQDPQMREHLEKIERDARDTREAVTKIINNDTATVESDTKKHNAIPVPPLPPEVKAEAARKNTVKIETPLLNEAVMKEKIRMIEDLDASPDPAPKSSEGIGPTVKEQTPPAPPLQASVAPPKLQSTISKPNIQFQKKPTIIDKLDVAVRRPGDKSAAESSGDLT